ncbi:carboxypeptidase-like regulatory domain-containing protein [Rufibacter psychrotolerans]|uniref:carboxypeptidase-like regulatory domain-containing protein n=1 Tax=Rufibacter psychrotolerans TaxID=2812556 RepID=UPI00196738BC|nr:carboxypeptidase-like regulatory domain-containing protein [Rufibacter sp. SYSU D00308]
MQNIVTSIKYHDLPGFVRRVFALFDEDYRRDSNQKYRGFLVFNKPMYHPGDTVRYKAYILRRNGDLYRKTLSAEVYGNRKTHQVGKLKPYQPGAYESAFVLHDSLKLTLDTYVSLDLMRGKKRWDDEEVMGGQFKYEEYELKENTYTLRLEEKEHATGATNKLMVQGTDANGLNLPDARVELTVLSEQLVRSREPSVFIADTLWTHKQSLESTGQTTIEIPASIFPKASVKYKVEAAFLNSSNERSTQSTQGTYLYQKGQLKLILLKDSVQALYLEEDTSLPQRAMLTVLAKNGKVLQKENLTLPTLLPLQAQAHTYELNTIDQQANLNLASKDANLNFFSDRTLDSVFFTAQNPRRLPFWYFVYQKNKLISRGHDTAAHWSFARKLQGHEPYYVSFQYLWAGEMHQSEYGTPFREKELSVAIAAPPTVYPGQQTNITVAVTNAKGKPVSNVDLTAYALTSKFKDTVPPKVPFFGYYKGRKARSKFHLENITPWTGQKLDWSRWSREMGLDSIAYYQLLYPTDGSFTNYSPAPDSLTQFAPFVVDSGRVVPVHVVYLDGVPVYFSGTDIKPAYSFPADSGFHTIKLRTAQHTITLDSIYFKPQQKLVLSIDQNKMPELLAAAEKNKLAPSERANLNAYLLPVEQNFHEGVVYLHQGNRVQLLPNNSYGYRHNSRNTNVRYPILLAGPFRPDSLYFRFLGNFTTGFIPEPNYTYRFEPGLLKMREKQALTSDVHLARYAREKLSPTKFSEKPTTDVSLRRLWQKLEEQRWIAEITAPAFKTGPGTGLGKLSWQLDTTFKQTPQHIFLFNPKEPADSVLVFKGDTRLVSHITPGPYRFTMLFPDHTQLSTTATIQPDGLLHLNFTPAQLEQANTQSKALLKLVQQRVLEAKALLLEAQKPKPPTPPKVTPLTNGVGIYNHVIRGTVADAATGEPLPGVSIVVKGTNVGVATDIDGQFSINAPANGVLILSYIGYVNEEAVIQGQNILNVALQADAKMLQEVVVVGYGTQRRSELTGAVTTVHTALYGRVAGVAIGQPGADGFIRIRGASSILGNTQPLIIVDGLPFDGEVSDLESNAVASMSILKDAAATALYGARAANGVVIITTKKGKEQAEQALAMGTEADPTTSIRSYFSDYAFWQPRLTTDKQGKATFPVTFPGDVTSWKAHVLAMDGKKRSGQTSTEIRSFKAMMAMLSGPRFLIEGDKTQIISKAVNYLPDTASVQTRFEFNGQALRQQTLKLGRVFTDTVVIQAPAVAPDSVELMYSLRQGSGFSDGERRHIGVYKKGVLERKGVFLSLPIDTTLTLTFDPAKGPVHFYAQSSLLQVMLDEIKALHRYEYWCNEQAASKLKGLLWEKRIQAALGKEFEHDKMVRRLIRHLEKTQKEDGTWSWWENGPAYLWISHHVTEALVMAQQEGYTTSFKKKPLVDYLTFHVEKKGAQNKIRALEILQKLEAKVDYPAYVTKLEKQPHNSLEDQFRLTRLRQQLNLRAPLDTLQKYRRSTTLGGLHWGENKSSLFNNHISNTLLAYEILKAAGGHERDLLRIQAFLLNERRTGYWRNTYESARILETLLPDLVKEKGQTPEKQLFLSGGVNTTLKKFPADTTFTLTQPLTIRKQGSLALYLTAYQNEWIAQPTRVEKDFVVRTRFIGTGSTQATLEAGKPVEMEVAIDVKADASYVMIEVPIPAGCTYDSKSSWGRYEAHREYFRHKVSIFSNHLSKGHYTFTVKLLPRYKGTYTLNPAKAELMYFPTFFGREGVKEVEVK